MFRLDDRTDLTGSRRALGTAIADWRTVGEVRHRPQPDCGSEIGVNEAAGIRIARDHRIGFSRERATQLNPA